MIVLFVCLGVFVFLALIASIVLVKTLGLAAATVIATFKIIGPILIVAIILFFIWNGVSECRINQAKADKAAGTKALPKRRRRK